MPTSAESTRSYAKHRFANYRPKVDSLVVSRVQFSQINALTSFIILPGQDFDNVIHLLIF